MTTFTSPSDLRAAIAAVKAELHRPILSVDAIYFEPSAAGRSAMAQKRADILRASIRQLEAEWRTRWPQDYADTIAAEDARHAAAYRASVERDLAAAEEALILARNAPPGRFVWMYQFGIETAERNVITARARLASLSTPAASIPQPETGASPSPLGCGAAGFYSQEAA